MSEFIKKNMTLVVVLGLTALIAVVLIALVVMHYSAINAKMTNIDSINDEINSITAETNPRIVKENASRINADAAALEAKTKVQQRVFGFYLDPALNTFIETLQKEAVSAPFKESVAKISPESLRKSLVKQVAAMDKNFKVKNPSFDGLKKLYSNVKAEILAGATEEDVKAYDKAFAAFLAEAGKVTLENLNIVKDDFAVKESIFLQALGLPRSFERALGVFTPYFSKYALDIAAKKKIPFAYMDKDNNEKRIIEFFTSHAGITDEEDDGDTESPLNKINNENIPYLMTRIQIYENLIQNLGTDGAKLVSIYRRGDYAPEIQNGYATYSTQMKIYGTLPQIREFANKLHQEYQNNRVYLVTYLNLSVDDASLKDDSDSEHSKEVANALSYVKLLKEADALKANEGNEDVKQSQMNESIIKDNWGAALIGVNDKLFAVFHINYIVFTGDQITNAKK